MMSGMQKIQLKTSIQATCFFMGILLLKLNCVQQNKHDAIGGVGNSNFFRFQSFEPRGILLDQQIYSNESLTPSISTTSRRFEQKQYERAVAEVIPPKREGRGFYFQATDQDITVDSEFIIPFFRVPIGWSSNFVKTSMRKLLNLQTGALLWSGAIVAVGAIVAGVINTVIAIKPALTTAFYGQQYKETRGLSDSQEFWRKGTTLNKDSPPNLVNFLDAKLHEHNIDLKSCLQRSICHYIEKSENNMRAGKASSSQKILFGVLRTQNVRQLMRGTAVFSAIEAGQNLSCEFLEHRCKLPKFEKSSIIKFMKKYIKNR